MKKIIFILAATAAGGCAAPRTPPHETAKAETPALTTGAPAKAVPLDDLPALLRELRAIATTNTEAALDRAMTLPNGYERSEALSAVCLGLAQDDPAQAVNLAQSLYLDQMPGAVVEELIQQWASSDFAAALTWANNISPGRERDAVMTRLGFVLSETDPSDAANLVQTQIPPGRARDEAVMTVLHQWAMRDMAAAAAWVATFPETPLRQRALEELKGIEKYQ
ncbi:MAG: hypothetical protein KGR98_08180 [Verrucomicrobia bacterium]|nr:hypothetical protein [Verrucomicrobiota bacterium]MDE3097866.1 hypothetical protein [Verrucomicrobiota bacterium]